MNDVLLMTGYAKFLGGSGLLHCHRTLFPDQQGLHCARLQAGARQLLGE
jgi:hypothetical protein